MKRKILFVAHHLTVGGAQKSMISALKAIDYDENDVTLYVRKSRLDLLLEVDKRVKVIVNDDKTHYYRSIYPLCMLMRINVCKLFGNKEKAGKLQAVLAENIRNRMLQYEKKRFFEDKKYDAAISYIQGYTSDLVADAVCAEKKYVFYHSSTDEAHGFHERIFRKYDKIFAVGDAIKDILCGLYPQFCDKIEVLYNYVDHEDVRKKASEFSVSLPHGKTILCSCGRLNIVKGFDLALETAKRLKESGLDFIWYFIGDGPERETLEKTIKEYVLDDNIVITGMQSNPYPWINTCDIYVQPSYEESYSLTIKEAQILNKPVISTATVGGKYLVKNGENGILSEMTPEALAESIKKLIADVPLRTKIEDNLRDIDHSQEFYKYASAWKGILEE